MRKQEIIIYSNFVCHSVGDVRAMCGRLFHSTATIFSFNEYFNYLIVSLIPLHYGYIWALILVICTSIILKWSYYFNNFKSMMFCCQKFNHISNQLFFTLDNFYWMEFSQHFLSKLSDKITLSRYQFTWFLAGFFAQRTRFNKVW